MYNFTQWEGFEGRRWKEKIDLRDFIQNNYTPYDGDESFLEGTTEATDKLWGRLQELQAEERAKGGVLDMETEVVSSLTSYGPGYIDESMKDLEQVVGLQTDKPLKRAFMPYGGIKMAEQSCKMYGYEPSEKLHEIFTVYHKTHNDAVFDIYTDEMKKARHCKILTGLPDTYGRGRIVGDYRRVALYGVDRLIEGKKKDFDASARYGMRRGNFQLREELAEQIKALKGMKEMAAVYGIDISQPAATAKEATQWLYFGYLAAIKTQNGAAFTLVDVRRADEYETAHIPSAINVPNEAIASTQPDALPDLNETIVVYCRTGVRSKEAADKLVAMGYTDVRDMGGITSWPYDTIAGTEPGEYAVAASESVTASTGLMGSFSAKDLDGNDIDQSIFAEYDLTMVNVWATYCGPCISEMPELGELAGEFESQGVRIVGMVSDVLNSDGTVSDSQLDTARSIVTKTSADYLHIVPSEDLYGLLSQISAVPTTFFVDSDGAQVGSAYLGSRSKAEWNDIILQMLEGI